MEYHAERNKYSGQNNDKTPPEPLPSELERLLNKGREYRRRIRKEFAPATRITTEMLQMRLDAYSIKP